MKILKALKKIQNIKIKFQMSLLLLIFLVLSSFAIATFYSVLSIVKKISEEKARNTFQKTAKAISIKFESQIDKSFETVDFMVSIPKFNSPITGNGLNYPGLQFMLKALEHNKYFYSLYVGKKNGTFIQVIRASKTSEILSKHNAPEGTEYIVRTISSQKGKKILTWSYLNNNLKVIHSKKEYKIQYTPAERYWFKFAMANGGKAALTETYMYNSLNKLGVTAVKALSKKTVVGIDITLENFDLFLDKIQLSGNTCIFVIDSKNHIMAANKKAWRHYPGKKGQLVTFRGIKQYASTYSPSMINTRDGIINTGEDQLLSSNNINNMFGNNIQLVMHAPLSDFLGYEEIIITKITIAGFIIFILLFPAAYFISTYFSRFIEALLNDAQKIQELQFDDTKIQYTKIVEFRHLADAIYTMKKSLAAKTKELKIALKKLERIIELGIAMSSEKDSDRVVEMILKGAKELSCADGGSLYLKNYPKNELEFKIILNDSLGIKEGGTSPQKISLPNVKLCKEDGTKNFNNVVSFSVNQGVTKRINDAYKDPEFDFSGTRKFDELNNYRSKSFLTVPLKLLDGDIIGALQLINCQNKKSKEIIPFDENNQSFIEALSALAASILVNKMLHDSQNHLFESLIKLIATSIDVKSPHTGRHCERVPVLTEMLADEAEKTTTGRLANFKFASPEEKQAFIIGSWLHDAGKMTTPEFVADKSVKLETIYNRIHEIRTRFEVLLRDAEIECKNAIIKGDSPEEANAQFEKAKKELFKDFQFVAHTNNNNRKLTPETKERIESIANKTWESHFDHTIGLSKQEEESIKKSFKEGETTTEKLLDDKSEHLIPNRKDIKYIYQDYNFILPKPEYLYNRGELYNLLIERGTLTSEERFKINEHIMQTIVMLDQLPFPPGMDKIPEFVSAHHETLTGEGYPYGISGDEISIPARILTIADIFEALTASERPYKKAYKLSQAVEILYDMKKKGRIDGEIFDLLLTSGVYLKYAKRFLPPDLIDEIDIERFTGK